VQRFLALLRPRLSSVLIGVGVITLVTGVAVNLAPRYESARWQSSPEAARAQRNADLSPPIWLTPTPATTNSAKSGAVAFPKPRQPAPRVNPTPATVVTREPAGPGMAVQPTPAPAPDPELPAPTPVVSDLTLLATEFQFLDPPEPGASARLSVTVNNPTDTPSGPISLVLPLAWLTGYRIQAFEPGPLDGVQNSAPADDSLRLTFAGPDAQSDLDLTVDVVAVDEVVDAPMLQVLDAYGAEVGRVQPPTQAPPPRPGPIYSIDIPNLRLHAGVVPVDWEPPLFVVGQIRTSAYVTQGNSVLVGHVRGAVGYNVFDNLDRLSPGDKIIASSRGETYDFVVSQTQVLPEDDTSPTRSTAGPRLTLMTCAGDWNPLTRDYSERLWVIAEPADAVMAQPVPEPPPPAQISARGGLGNTDTDLVAAFGAPVGESADGLAVYRAGGANEHRAQLADVPAGQIPRAVLVADVPPPEAPLSFEAAVTLSRGLLPNDAQPRARAPEGNQRFIVERFTSPALATTLQTEGDLLVVYARRPDGRIAFVVVGVGDDAEALLSRLKDVRP
jgi:LPXTG-site transpeptidase (sortase) family protein